MLGGYSRHVIETTAYKAEAPVPTDSDGIVPRTAAEDEREAGESVRVRAYANLALVKYWGKRDSLRNLPATPSIGINLTALQVDTQLRDTGLRRSDGSGEITVTVDGLAQESARYAGFMRALAETAGFSGDIVAVSRGSFPAGAGLASSAAGFAALAVGCAELAKRSGGPSLSEEEISALARVGSGSAARAVIGGFSLFAAGATHATQLADARHWPELRVVIATVTTRAKDLSSRSAMERTRHTSPYFSAWVSDSGKMADEAMRRIAERDLEALGDLVRASYARMHATMLGAQPPIRYWSPVSLEVLDACEELRRRGVPAFETMDAGPQVKILTSAEHVAEVLTGLEGIALAGKPVVSSIAGAPELVS